MTGVNFGPGGGTGLSDWRGCAAQIFSLIFFGDWRWWKWYPPRDYLSRITYPLGDFLSRIKIHIPTKRPPLTSIDAASLTKSIYESPLIIFFLSKMTDWRIDNTHRGTWHVAIVKNSTHPETSWRMLNMIPSQRLRAWQKNHTPGYPMPFSKLLEVQGRKL